MGAANNFANGMHCYSNYHATNEQKQGLIVAKILLMFHFN